MRKFDEWIGPYPYPQITVVDPPHGGDGGGRNGVSDADYGGHNVVDAEMRCWSRRLVVEHEFGHQYWYGMVATNEFENAWMDEGINQYMEAKVMDALYGKDDLQR